MMTKKMAKADNAPPNGKVKRATAVISNPKSTWNVIVDHIVIVILVLK